jgi:leader peptidase (prepilin peptidase)/N-methyltransferase
MIDMGETIMLPTIFLAAVCGLLGLAVGSFLNVVIYRVPLGRSIVRPPSACPSCGAGIRPMHNIPVLGWLLLRGRCATCRAPISARYPLVEAGTGVAFAAVAATTSRPWLLVVLLYLTAVGIALAMIDLDTHRLPDAVVLPSYAVVLALLGGATLASGTWSALARALLGGLVSYAVLALIRFGWPGGMGGGDVKLAGLLGLVTGWLGWSALVVGLAAAFVVGAAVGSALMVMGRAGRGTAIPFGPFLLVGAFLGIYAGRPLADAYLGLLVPGAT